MRDSLSSRVVRISGLILLILILLAIVQHTIVWGPDSPLEDFIPWIPEWGRATLYWIMDLIWSLYYWSMVLPREWGIDTPLYYFPGENCLEIVSVLVCFP